jgi:hypothetical protein
MKYPVLTASQATWPPTAPVCDRRIDPTTASPFYPTKRRGRAVLISVNGRDAALVDSGCEPAAIAAAIERLVLSILENDDVRA